MNNSDNRYLDTWVSLGLIVALLVMAALLLLSSRAEASYGVFDECFSICNPVSPSCLVDYGDAIDMYGDIQIETPFEAGAPPIEYLLHWPDVAFLNKHYYSKAQMAVEVVKEYQSDFLEALGMMFFFGGIMAVIVLVSQRKRVSKKDTI